MAEFEAAFNRTLQNEGGYVLHDIPQDRGGMTYAGIARNYHGAWKGWDWIDRGQRDHIQLTEMVQDFYRKNFWNPIQGEAINAQDIAESLYDFAVNAGVRTAVKLAQLVVEASPDGVVGPRTLEKLNAVESESFILRYALAKVTRYAAICNRTSSQKKFLLGWINRTLEGLS